MSVGLHIKRKREFRYGIFTFWVIFFGICTATMWYGYRYYTLGELPPVPLPVATAQADVDESPIEQTKRDEHTAEPLHPKSLTIESLDIVKARVFPVGLKPNNEVDTPHNINDIGWYNKSSMPGEDLGAVLLDGHNGGPTKDGVFKNLPSLAVGSKITIQRGDGREVNYMVKDVKIIDLEELNNGAMDEITKPIDAGSQGLTLIGCTGRWVPAKDTYDARVIVRASEI